MSDLPGDSKNINLSDEEVDVTGSSDSIDSIDSSKHTVTLPTRLEGPSCVYSGLFHHGGHSRVLGVVAGRVPDPERHRSSSAQSR